MSRFRSHWLAIFAGATLITLSVSTAFGAKPDADTNAGQQVSAYIHSLVGDVEEPAEEPVETETDTPDDTDTQVDESESSDHGACVSEVAKGDEVGGDNVNHGGAVSEAARVTCDEDATTEEPTAEQPADDEGDTEVEADDSTETEADATDQSDNGHGHGGDHGDKSDKGDSSED